MRDEGKQQQGGDAKRVKTTDNKTGQKKKLDKGEESSEFDGEEEEDKQ